MLYEYLKIGGITMEKVVVEVNKEDPFYSTANIKRLKKAIKDVENRKVTVHDIIEMEEG